MLLKHEIISDYTRWSLNLSWPAVEGSFMSTPFSASWLCVTSVANLNRKWKVQFSVLSDKGEWLVFGQITFWWLSDGCFLGGHLACISATLWALFNFYMQSLTVWMWKIRKDNEISSVHLSFSSVWKFYHSFIIRIVKWIEAQNFY